ncbi:hypothetical protein [Stygiolobus azoricus]|uniref:PH domain-containing protein n=1 Tax=Stygiolobus azoricus TaxID=41675 RepID=A0A650CLN8_9CREN|nr:hypothetical protein [Stygiolobus azoricus]QGR18605.1 hypothetical protein D1868_00390 [Stygiolobus azoricus]
MIFDDYYSYRRKSFLRLSILAGFIPILILEIVVFGTSSYLVDLIIVFVTLVTLFIPSKLFYAYKIENRSLYALGRKILDLTDIRSVIIENRRIEGRIYMGDLTIYTKDGKRITLPKILNPDLLYSTLSGEKTPNDNEK